MLRVSSALLVIALIAGCTKDSEPAPAPPPPKPIDLLTNGKWQLTAYGWDDDNSGKLEDHENMIPECHKDNTTQYFRDGKGTTHENQLVCNADTGSSFQWKFIDDDKAIEIGFQRLDIHKLTKDELHFKVHIQGLAVPFHTMYRKL